MRREPLIFWYDVFSSFYDSSLESLYRDARERALEACRLSRGQRVLDLPTGTGQSLEFLAPAVGAEGAVVGVDASRGMLDRARRRVERQGWSQVTLIEADARQLDAAAVGDGFDCVHIFLGLSTFPEWEQAFGRAWTLLRPGGRCVVVDVYAETLSFQGRMVNWMAGAEIRRRTWSELERVGQSFEKSALPPKKQYGGELFLATAIKA